MIKADCTFWQEAYDLCGITGDNKCKQKCKDYKVCDEYDDDFEMDDCDEFDDLID